MNTVTLSHENMIDFVTLTPGDAPSGGDEAAEIGAASEAAHLNRGRPWLRDRIKDATGNKPGGDKARRLLALGRDVHAWLQDAGYTLCNGMVVDSETMPVAQPWLDARGDVW